MFNVFLPRIRDVTPGAVGSKSSHDLDHTPVTGFQESAFWWPQVWADEVILSCTRAGLGLLSASLQPRGVKRMGMADALEMACVLGKRDHIPLIREALPD